MSGDPEQEYFADGMVEEATTAIFLPSKSVVFQSLKDGGGFR
jgi:TolB-like protein